MEKSDVIKRKKARRVVLQALYQWMMAHNELNDIEAQFQVNHDFAKIDYDYFQELLYGIPKHISTIDETITPLLDRPFEQLNPIELTALRMATYELLHRLDIPYKVCINEAVKLTREFGAEEGHKYVNGVVDKLAKSLRPHE